MSVNNIGSGGIIDGQVYKCIRFPLVLLVSWRCLPSSYDIYYPFVYLLDIYYTSVAISFPETVCLVIVVIATKHVVQSRFCTRTRERIFDVINMRNVFNIKLT
uniref:Uncharacterized protein n=1 Tax=Glossina brevipalpis TaxID=37001 RepID=A0A1A9WNN0_9MUSC